MMKHLRLLVVTLLAFAFGESWAQDRNVTGTVTSAEDGSALPGVNVVLKGTTNGTITDADGKYTLSIPSDGGGGGGTLVFSFIGLTTDEVEIGSRSVIDFSMSEDVKQLGEVVVTAMGVSREKRSLGYAVSTVKSKDLEQKTQGDIGRVLNGKLPGARITQNNGMSGSGTNIIIRGYSSINQSNQPLFIVDGVPFNSGTNASQDFEDGKTESSRFLDLDPNSIESISVLKGLSAATLYGEKGRNGVILITTKNANTENLNRKLEVSLAQSYFINEISSLPTYQTKYGGGWQQYPAFYFSNWGASFDNPPPFKHPYGSFRDGVLQKAFSEKYKNQKYVYKNYNSVKKFFQKGRISNTFVNVRGGNEKAGLSMSYGNLHDEGFTPGNKLKRHNFGFGGRAKLTNNIGIKGTFNYTYTDYKSPPVSVSQGSGATGANASIFAHVLYNPRSVDLFGLPYKNPINGGSVYYRSGNDIQNVRWTIENAIVRQRVNRFYGNMSADYNITDWLNVSYRLGIDHYNEFNSYGQNKGGTDSEYPDGMYRTLFVYNTIWDHTFTLSGQKAINSDINLLYQIGANPRLETNSRDGLESTKQVAFGKLEHFNFLNTSKIQNNSDTQSTNDTQIGEHKFSSLVGYFANLSFDYKNSLFLTLAGRYDISSTLEDKHNSIFYPSASVAYDFISGLPALQNNDVIDFLKLRLGYGTSAGFPTPYRTRNTINLTASSFVDSNGNTYPSLNTNDVLGNSELKPETVGEFEIGLETRLIDNKLGLEVSYFNKSVNDLIIKKLLDPSTGYKSTFINGGEMKVTGWEVALQATPLIIGDFQWDIAGNFYADESTVVSLPGKGDKLVIAGYTNLGNFAVKGEPFGVMYGSVVERKKGKKVVGADGTYKNSQEIGKIGDPNPDFTTALTNTFSYKGFNFSFEFQYRHGGDIYSVTAGALLARGVTEDTGFNRDKTWILDGVKDTKDDRLIPNDFVLTSTKAYWTTYYGADEHRVWDGTTIRLNEVSLSYSLPESMLSKTPFGRVSITASGFNLWQKALNFPEHINFDTNVSATGVGNGQGFDFLSGPASKRYGVSLKITL